MVCTKDLQTKQNRMMNQNRTEHISDNASKRHFYDLDHIVFVAYSKGGL